MQDRVYGFVSEILEIKLGDGGLSKIKKMQKLRMGAERPKADQVDITLKEQEQELLKSAENLKKMMNDIKKQQSDLQNLNHILEQELSLVRDGQRVDALCDPSHTFDGTEEGEASRLHGMFLTL